MFFQSFLNDKNIWDKNFFSSSIICFLGSIRKFEIINAIKKGVIEIQRTNWKEIKSDSAVPTKVEAPIP